MSRDPHSLYLTDAELADAERLAHHPDVKPATLAATLHISNAEVALDPTGEMFLLRFGQTVKGSPSFLSTPVALHCDVVTLVRLQTALNDVLGQRDVA